MDPIKRFAKHGSQTIYQINILYTNFTGMPDILIVFMMLTITISI